MSCHELLMHVGTGICEADQFLAQQRRSIYLPLHRIWKCASSSLSGYALRRCQYVPLLLMRRDTGDELIDPMRASGIFPCDTWYASRAFVLFANQEY